MISVRTATKRVAHHGAVPAIPSGTSIEHVTPVRNEEIGVLPSRRGFMALLAAYQPTGGTAIFLNSLPHF